ncbi:MAG: enoyl-CoA hydratase-related protein [Gammaproteobacteria bacterium]|nr:enoyl-CoA hydratase-related protein [Gammaproteobacteria bacterium]
MSEPLVTYERDGHIATLTLNRPKAMNAMNMAMMSELAEVTRQFAADDDAWVGILRGQGRAFCTGGDLKESLELMGGDPGRLFVLPRHGLETFNAIAELSKPIIAAVHGFAVAGGLLIAHACHLVVAGESTQFGMPETRVGMPTMGYIDLWKTVGPRRLLEMTLTGENFSAAHAHEAGLVNRVVADEAVFEEARKLADTIAANSPRSVAGHLEAVRLSVRHNKEVLTELQHSIWDKVVYSEDLKEGLTAFQERRKPEWKNR